MSILKKENKIQSVCIDDMFEIDVSQCMFDMFDGLRYKIKQTYSKDILHTILNADTPKIHYFGEVSKMKIFFSTLGVFRVVYRGDILDRLEWKIRISSSNDELAMNNDTHYMLRIIIKTDEAREFISDLIDEIESKNLNK